MHVSSEQTGRCKVFLGCLRSLTGEGEPYKDLMALAGDLSRVMEGRSEARPVALMAHLLGKIGMGEAGHPETVQAYEQLAARFNESDYDQVLSAMGVAPLSRRKFVTAAARTEVCACVKGAQSYGGLLPSAKIGPFPVGVVREACAKDGPFLRLQPLREARFVNKVFVRSAGLAAAAYLIHSL